VKQKRMAKTQPVPCVVREGGVAEDDSIAENDERVGLHPLTQAIEQLAYDFLRETHAGWENNEGAYGDFHFDVTERSITLNYNERIETSEYTQHVF
jgi:hypothetical protein